MAPEIKPWSRKQLAQDAARARRAFRRERLDEPRALYLDAHRSYSRSADEMLDMLTRLADRTWTIEEVAATVANKDKLTVLRYATAPPISADDLATLAETRLSAPAIAANRPAAARIRDTILDALDPVRFPWSSRGRPPTKAQRNAAVLATATLLATQSVQTSRRMDARRKQESSVARWLIEAGFQQVKRRKIALLGDAPDPGQFCAECHLGDTKADFVVVRKDRVVVPIECKASNSDVNSFKRLIHEAAGKAAKCRRKFGDAQVVPVAVLSGCYKAENLVEAQRQGLALVWSHRLDSLQQVLLP